MAKPGHSVVLVLDYGSQYTQLICRRVRELGVYSVMLPGDVTQARGRHAARRAATAVMRAKRGRRGAGERGKEP